MAPQNTSPTPSNSINTSSSSSSSVSSSFTSSSSASSLTASSTSSSFTGSPSNSSAITGSSPSNSTIHVAASKGLSSGAAAGVGIGAGLGGILLALVAVWIFFKCTGRSRSPRRAYTRDTNSTRPRDYINKPIPVVNTVGVKDDSPLERADDSQIRKFMQDLNELINQHVENHYHGRNIEGRTEDLKRELVNCGYSDRTEPSAQALSVLLNTPATRTTAIRQLVGSVIMHHIELKSDPETSLLPGHIAGFCQATLRTKRSPADEEVFSKSFSKWRLLSAALLASNPSDGEKLMSDSSLRPGVIRNVQLLHNILLPFINPGTENQRAQSDNLASIILEGAHFGVLLFSQPSVWVFGWEAKSGTGGKGQNKDLVVFPSISEVILRGGREDLRVIVDAVKEKV